MEVCKSVHICPKNDLRVMVEILNRCTGLLTHLCSVKKNRTFMLASNMVIPLVDLLHWSWSNSSKYVYCFNFIPDIFHLINFLLRHASPQFDSSTREEIVEYIICCGLLIKLK